MKPPIPSEELGKPERPPATYATAYSSFRRKPEIFNRGGEIRLCARVDSYPRGALSYSVSIWALSGASRKLESRECAAFLFRVDGLLSSE